jgi:uncharacterized protein (TIGR00251 family)
VTTPRPVRLNVHVQPRASRSEIVGPHGDALKIRLAAPPVDNAANEELVAFIAARLGIARRQVRVIGGLGSRRKLVEIDGVEAAVISATLR